MGKHADDAAGFGRQGFDIHYAIFAYVDKSYARQHDEA